MTLDGFEIHGFVGSNMVLVVDRDQYLTKVITILSKKFAYQMEYLNILDFMETSPAAELIILAKMY